MWVDPTGRKMSKTLGNTVELDVLNKFFPIDAIRYFVLREMVFGQDGRFGYENLIDRANSDLASGLGNLSSRTLTMIHRYCDGKIPPDKITDENRLAAKRAGVEDETAIADFISHARDEFVRYFDELAFSRALEEAWGIVARVDKMISDAKPWNLAKDATQRQTLNAVLYRAAEALRWLAVTLYPVMPTTAGEIYQQLGLSDEFSTVDPRELRWGGLKPDIQIKEVKALFPRIDKAKTMEEIKQESIEQRSEVRDQRSEAERGSSPTVREGSSDAGSGSSQGSGQHATEADAVPGVASYIDITDFAKVELRVAEVKTAERIPKADKLLLLTVDVGEEQPRTILAGIAQYYEPENLVGRKIVVVANLKPRKLRGYESQGMLLAASIGDEGKPVIATFAEDVPNGARLK
jgi:methionyl-tRNA synthetase